MLVQLFRHPQSTGDMVSHTLLESLAVVRCVAGVVPVLGFVLASATTAAEHLVEEAAKLGVGEREEGDEGDEEPHCHWG